MELKVELMLSLYVIFLAISNNLKICFFNVYINVFSIFLIAHNRNLRWETGLGSANDVMHWKCAEDFGRFEKVR